MKVHLSPDGKPRPCKATSRPCPLRTPQGLPVPHYASLEEAQEALAALEASPDSLKGFSKKQVTSQAPASKILPSGRQQLLPLSREEAEEVIASARAFGLDASFAEALQEDFFHEQYTSEQVLIASEVGDTVPSETWGCLPQKPRGGLWLSPQEEEESGVTAWTRWATEADYLPRGKKPTKVKVVLQPEAVVLTLTETTVKNVEAWLDAVDGKQEEPGLDLRTVLGRSRKTTPAVPWERLKHAGITAVRVDGRFERDVFYGWDCDSMVVLRGSGVKDVLPTE